jgi:hypothetical protein
LEAAILQCPRQTDPFVEQLKQCPEVFKAGEMIGQMLDSLKYSQDNDATGDRSLPPASQRRFSEKTYCDWESADQRIGLAVRLISWNAVSSDSVTNMAINM